MDNLVFPFFFLFALVCLFLLRFHSFPPATPITRGFQRVNPYSGMMPALIMTEKTDSVNHSGLAVFFCVAARHDTLHFINHVLHFAPRRADTAVTRGDNIEDGREVGDGMSTTKKTLRADTHRRAHGLYS